MKTVQLKNAHSKIPTKTSHVIVIRLSTLFSTKIVSKPTETGFVLLNFVVIYKCFEINRNWTGLNDQFMNGMNECLWWQVYSMASKLAADRNDYVRRRLKCVK